MKIRLVEPLKCIYYTFINIIILIAWITRRKLQSNRISSLKRIEIVARRKVNWVL